MSEQNVTLQAWYTVELLNSRCHRLHHNLAALVPGDTQRKLVEYHQILNPLTNLIFHGSKLLLVLPSYLWCHKIGSVTGGEEQAVSSTKLLGKSKITYPDRIGISRVVHVEDVTGLQVSVYHLCMECFREGKAPPPSNDHVECFLTPWQWR